MASLIVYGISNCDTVRKAKRWLDDNDIEYSFHDFRKDGLSGTVIKNWCKQRDWQELINRRGTTYRSLSESTKKNLNQQSAIKLMQSNPTLIKRPVIAKGNKIIVGFEPSVITGFI